MTHRMSSARRLTLLVGVAFVVIVATAACASDSNDSATPPPAPEVATPAEATPMAEVQPSEPVMVVEGLRARATPGLENENSAAYARITNTGTVPDRLVAASVDESVASRVELHTTVREGDMMRMIQVEEGWAIPAGETLELMPGGNHIMLIGIARQFVVDDTFSLTLTFEQAGSIVLDVPVVEIATTGLAGGEGGGVQPSASPMP
jgi:periplasmic copper chaperone A